MSAEIQLIREIEKQECLYNFTLPEYNRKEITEDAWSNVAVSTNLAISDCKEKWRNIRSSFLRSLKPGGNKTKKPYYLSDFLQFLIPYLKPVNNDISQHTHNDVTEPDIEIKQEFVDEHFDNQQYEISVPKDQDQEQITRRSLPMRRRKRLHNFKSHADLRAKRRFVCKTSTNPDILQNESPPNAMRYFLMSLLPEFDTMNEEQLRTFKIKVMMLINDIKTDPETNNVPKLMTEGDRQQKRLINLLIRTLSKKKL